MGRLLLTFLFLSAYAQAADQVLTIPRAAYPRAKDESDLERLLRQDIRDASVGKIDWKLRTKIRILAVKVSAEY